MSRTESELSAYVCGVCFDLKPAHYQPTLCFQCGAVFERGAPIALASLVFPVDGDIEQRVDFLGRWSIDARSLAMLRLSVGREDDNATRGAVDRG